MSFACSFRSNISRYHYRIAVASVHVNSNLLSAKIEQSSVLIHNANCQIRKVSYNDWKVNDLRRPFRYRIFRQHAWRKFVYRVQAPVVAIRTRGYVALDTYDIHVDDIYQHVQMSRLQHVIRQKSQQQAIL